jgi:enterochelin esterase-like enzyme
MIGGPSAARGVPFLLTSLLPLPGRHAPGASPLARRLAAWGYPGDRRDARLDLLRGLAALAMIVDHVGGNESWLYLLSGGDRFFVSAAEGFIFISGLVMGIVYSGVIARQGLRAALGKGARRVGTLYALTVGLALSFALFSTYLGLSWAPQLGPGGFAAFAADVITLRRAYYLTDVMLFYTFAVAAALPVLALLRRGGGGWVLAGTWALWAAWQAGPGALRLPWPIIDHNTFNFAAWQVLFLTGLILGYHRRALEARLAGWRARTRATVRNGALIGSGAVVGGSLALYAWYQAHPGDTALGVLLGQLFGKSDLRAGRLALFACLFVFAYLLTTVLWEPIRRAAGWLLLPLGRDALTVYTLHLFAVGALIAADPWLLGSARPTILDTTLRQGAVVLLIAGLVWGKTQRTAIHAALARRLAWLPASAAHLWPGWLDLAPVRGMAPARTWPRTLAALVLTALVVDPQGPIQADALARSLALPPPPSRVAPPNLMAAPEEQAGAPPPSDVPMIQAQSLADFNLLVSGTAVPGVIPTPAALVLPDYVEQHTFRSVSLEREMPYYIFLPPGYADDPTVRYPVLYMLHGMQGSYNEWLSYGLLGRAHDMMSAGQIAPFLIVVPQGDQSYWVDHADGGPRWGTYVEQDLVAEIDIHFRTRPDRQHRAVGGLSMGGYGALQLGINYPNVFGVVGAHSPSLHGKDDAPPFLGDQTYFNQHDPVYLYRTEPEIARTLQIYIDVGQDDPWHPAIAAFHQQLLAEGIAHEWRLFPGDHGGTYWSTYTIDYLLFYSRALTTPLPPPTPTAAASPPAPPARPGFHWGGYLAR